MEEQEKIISISPKQLGAFLVVVATVVGGPGVLNLVDSGTRADPFTGTEGRQLRAYVDRELAECSGRIDHLEQWRHDHEKRATDWTNEWNKWAGQINAEHREFHRIINK